MAVAQSELEREERAAGCRIYHEGVHGAQPNRTPDELEPADDVLGHLVSERHRISECLEVLVGVETQEAFPIRIERDTGQVRDIHDCRGANDLGGDGQGTRGYVACRWSDPAPHRTWIVLRCLPFVVIASA